MQRRVGSGCWKCCVNNCQNSSKTMSVHAFPKNRELALAWVAKLNLSSDLRKSYWKKRICHDHFQLLQASLPLGKHEANKIYLEHSYAYVGSIGTHKDKYKNLQMYIHTLEKENSDLKRKLEELKSNTMPERILEDPYHLNFYTGFNDPKQYKIFAGIIIEQGKKALQETRHRGLFILDMETQIFLVLSRLRVGLLVVDLSKKYNVSPATISIIFRFWVNVIYVYFKQLPIWASDRLIKEHLPATFKDLYPNTRIILDATEIFIEKPSDCIVQSSTYSEYKAHNTAKGLIGMSPNGFITFISELYPGRVSDKELVLLSGVLEKLEPGWAVMADRGFTIEEELKNINCYLNIPPFAQHGQNFQFNIEEEQSTRDIASARIHIERIIRNVKRYRILHGNVPNSISDQLNQIWFICCLINNFTGVPLLERESKK